jgi:3-O-methylgallate 3,4-dioxygenase
LSNRAGSSEVKNWVFVADAVAELPFEMTLVDYVPYYRSEAGTVMPRALSIGGALS